MIRIYWRVCQKHIMRPFSNKNILGAEIKMADIPRVKISNGIHQLIHDLLKVSHCINL